MREGRVTVSEAARLLGMSRQKLCYEMDMGRLQIGDVLPSKSGRTKRHYIYRGLLEKHMGVCRNEKED